jgi:hypothetical protein
MQHLDDGLIHELLDGEVPSDRLRPIQAHLADCAACRARLEGEQALLTESDGLIEALDEVEPVVTGSTPPTPRRVAAWPRQLAWAASLVLAVGIGYTARGGIDGPLPGLEDAMAPAPEAQAGAEADADATTPEAEQAPAEGPAPDPPVNRVTPPPAPARADERAPTGALASSERAAATPEQPVPTPAPAVDAAARRESRLAEDVGAQVRRFDDLLAGRQAPAAELAGANDFAGAAQPVVARAQEAFGGRGVFTTKGTPAGPLWRLDGSDLVRTTFVGDDVQLVYRHSLGEVVLIQRRIGDRMGWRLELPDAFPADSLEALRARVR